eukprot:COSAG02_NODE_13960_length_1327_cov_0.772801_2_plen_30_part_01
MTGVTNGLYVTATVRYATLEASVSAIWRGT